MQILEEQPGLTKLDLSGHGIDDETLHQLVDVIS
jgi:hypothetical protein